MGDKIESSPALGLDGSFDSKFYALTPNGTLMWSYTGGGPIGSSPPNLNAFR